MNQRALQVENDLKKDKEPDASYTSEMSAYRKYLQTADPTSVHHRIAFKIYQDPVQKEILEALLFGNADPAQVELVFEIPQETQDIYESLFFDRDNFITQLDRISYVENYSNQFGKELKLRSFHIGPEFIFFHYGNFIPKTQAQKDLLKKVFLSCSFKALNANFNAGGSKAAQAAIEQGKLMLKAYESLQKYADNDLDEGTDIHKIISKHEVEVITRFEIEIPKSDIV